MINYDVYESEVEKGKIKNGYIFCGLDEELIKDAISLIVKKEIQEDFKDLNCIQIDGMTTTFDEIMNACETLPFMSEKKVVIIYRAGFLNEKNDSVSAKLYDEMKKYLKDIPPHTILLMYYLTKDKRDKPNKNKKVSPLSKTIPVVYCDKLKRDKYLKKIGDIFKEKGKPIGRSELAYFSERVHNNFDVIRREADKLISYCEGREIKKADIDLLIANSSEDDIFDMVELIAQQKVDKAIDIMKEILYKSDQHFLIISAIEKQFTRLYEVKIGMLKGKRLDDFRHELGLPEFVCQKIMMQSRRFTEKQLAGLIKLCVDTERTLKSTVIDKNMEMEFLLINTLKVKK